MYHLIRRSLSLFADIYSVTSIAERAVNICKTLFQTSFLVLFPTQYFTAQVTDSDGQQIRSSNSSSPLPTGGRTVPLTWPHQRLPGNESELEVCTYLHMDCLQSSSLLAWHRQFIFDICDYVCYVDPSPSMKQFVIFLHRICSSSPISISWVLQNVWALYARPGGDTKIASLFVFSHLATHTFLYSVCSICLSWWPRLSTAKYLHC